jgi:hypothetical protein
MMPRSKDFFAMACPEFMERFSLENTLMNNALGLRAINCFPEFPDGCAMREHLAQKGLETPTTPDALLVEWLKAEKVVHGRVDEIFVKRCPGGLHLTARLVSLESAKL